MDITKIGSALELATKIAQGPKPGLQTTEFWMTTVVSAASMFAPPPYNILVPAVMTSVYTIGRQIIKALHASGMAKNIPDLPAPVEERGIESK